jgi:5-methylcytosine-specific restriction endonuclease McrA
MSSAYIPQALRQRVAEQARYRCGYCLTSEAIVGTTMEIDHIIPESLGGPTEEENLWLACSLCNDHKHNRITALDTLTGEIVALFDPRRQGLARSFCLDDRG